MRKEVVVTFEDGDIELLNKPLPKNPCTFESGCPMRNGGCCGCSAGDAYNAAIEPYKERGIYEIACKIQRRRDLMQQISMMKKEIVSIEEDIPEGIIEKNVEPELKLKPGDTVLLSDNAKEVRIGSVYVNSKPDGKGYIYQYNGASFAADGSVDEEYEFDDNDFVKGFVCKKGE
jgi:hypothetical protein